MISVDIVNPSSQKRISYNFLVHVLTENKHPFVLLN